MLDDLTFYFHLILTIELFFPRHIFPFNGDSKISAISTICTLINEWLSKNRGKKLKLVVTWQGRLSNVFYYRAQRGLPQLSNSPIPTLIMPN